MSGHITAGDEAAGGGPPRRWEPVAVPPPELDWCPAPGYQGNPNPAVQYGIWDSIALSHRPIGVLPPPMKAYADRLMLVVERSWEDLGDVEVASFRLVRRFFVLSQFTDVEDTGVTVWLDRRHTDDEASLALLVETLGIPGDCVRDISWCPHPVVRSMAPPQPEDRPGSSGWTRFLRRRRRPSGELTQSPAGGG
ncbi:hypothetical protein [Streptomyces erythrochromogenes]|uniref:hypothetical protein n=1 Tax=Streptomyces erythrochromogenes TaxID=285574 RepID=UPI00341BCE87